MKVKFKIVSKLETEKTETKKKKPKKKRRDVFPRENCNILAIFRIVKDMTSVISSIVR